MLWAIYIMVWLVVCSVYDWKYCGVPLWLLVVGSVGSGIGVICTLLWGETSIAEVLLALVPGMVAVLLAYASREQIGYGDGVVLLVIGSYAGVGDTLKILMLALAGTFGVSILLLICKKANGRSRIPFVPFLTMGSVLVMAGGWLTG